MLKRSEDQLSIIIREDIPSSNNVIIDFVPYDLELSRDFFLQDFLLLGFLSFFLKGLNLLLLELQSFELLGGGLAGGGVLCGLLWDLGLFPSRHGWVGDGS